jgi:hypothetical protein
METFTFDELFDQLPVIEDVVEATRPPTLPTGKYRLKEIKATPKVATERSPYPGRKMAHIQARAYNQEGTPAGTLFFDASWEEYRDESSGRQDTPYRIWNQIVKAVDGKALPVPKVIAELTGGQLDASVQEFYFHEDGRFVIVRSADERNAAVREGYDVRNRVGNVYPAR